MTLHRYTLNRRLAIAARLDLVEQRARRLAEKLGARQGWLQEFHGFLTDARMTQEEFWVRYTLKRLAAQEALAAVKDEDSARAFYAESDYMLWRNVVHRRHSAWRRVLVTMAGRRGRLLEFGCATAPVSAWVAARKPSWAYTLVDLPSPHLDYGAHRMATRRVSLAVCASLPPGHWEVITLLDVLEHLPDPLPVAKAAVGRLAAGGVLHWNFVGNPRRNDLDLATEQQQEETVAYLYDALACVWDRDGYRVSVVR